MTRWRSHLETLGRVVALDYPYMLNGRRSPDPLPKLVEAHRAALRAARGSEGSVVLIGKSMGSRVGCHVSLEETVSALVCLGYPLRGAGKKGALRDEVLKKLSTPILFVQGTRDPLCPLDDLAAVRPKMTARNELLVVEGGNHSLEVTAAVLRSRGETQNDVERRIVRRIAEFVQTLG
jgi:predicted alpha/beta-hydrolase family hydrolase